MTAETVECNQNCALDELLGIFYVKDDGRNFVYCKLLTSFCHEYYFLRITVTLVFVLF